MQDKQLSSGLSGLWQRLHAEHLPVNHETLYQLTRAASYTKQHIRSST